jgi:hypothetical protein
MDLIGFFQIAPETSGSRSREPVVGAVAKAKLATDRIVVRQLREYSKVSSPAGLSADVRASTTVTSAISVAYLVRNVFHPNANGYTSALPFRVGRAFPTDF